MNVGNVKEKVRCFLDFVLHDEFNRQDIHVAREHQGFLRNHLLPTLSIGPKSDFDTMELGHFRLQNGLDEWNLQMGAGPDGPHGDTEAFDDPFLIGSYDEGALPDQKDQQPSEEDISEAT